MVHQTGFVTTSNVKIDLSEFITNPTVLAAFDEKIILINETQNLMLRANVFHDLTIQTSIIPGEPYTLVLPSANSIYMTIGNDLDGRSIYSDNFNPGTAKIFSEYDDLLRVPVNHKGTNMPLLRFYDKNILDLNNNTINDFILSSSKIDPLYAVRSFDRLNVELYFFLDGVSGNYTALLTDKNENAVESTFSSFYSHNNVEWYNFFDEYTCPGDENATDPRTRDNLEVAVPFYTTEGLSDLCNLTVNPITLTSEHLPRLSKFRINVELKYDSDIMCLGGTSVTPRKLPYA